MFDPNVVKKLAEEYQVLFREMAAIEGELDSRFHDFKKPIHALILSVLSNETLLLIGPPGTGKSLLIRDFCELIGIQKRVDWVKEFNKITNGQGITNEERARSVNDMSPYYFEYLLTRFTEPGELFGFFDIGKLQHPPHKLERITTGMMQNATVVYLDEVFRGSSAILNSLLAFLNERFFHDRGDVFEANVQALFAATNDIPNTADLQAVFDRFVVRCWVHNLSDNEPDGTGNELSKRIPEYLERAWRETYQSHSDTTNPYRKDKLFKDLKNLNDKIKENRSTPLILDQTSSASMEALSIIVKSAAESGLGKISNRRLLKMVHVMLLATIYRVTKGEQTSPQPTVEEFCLYRYFLDVDPASETFKADFIGIDELIRKNFGVQ